MKNLLFVFVSIVLTYGFCSVSSNAGQQKTISLESLLNEMVDHAAVARWPEPAYMCKQSSSYDRTSTDPHDPEGWFANLDFSSFLRSEIHDGRTEWVMTDIKGPGALVRFWHGGPPVEGIVRIYLDDSDVPVLEGNVRELLAGKGIIEPPFSSCIIPENPVAGKNLYLPIPFAKRCVITYDGPNFRETNDFADGLYWNINYRTYAPGTKVETFSLEKFKRAKNILEKTGKILVDPPTKLTGRSASINRQIKPGKMTSLPLVPGPVAIRTLKIKLEAENIKQALRSTVLQMRFDNTETVWCPLGDFFGSGVGINFYSSWYRTVKEDGTMLCRWVMPYKESANLTVTNFGKEAVNIELKVVFDQWTWDDRSMHFHTIWHYQWPFDSYPRFDWNFIKIKGQGVMVGDTLALMSSHTIWWGEGDEKIYIDDETFPSHFGTGTEDYYGYAYGTPVLFSKPFHAQPNVGLYAHMGHRTNTRSRSLDAIPFEKSLQFDIESWGPWAGIPIAFAGTTYWYARPQATCNYAAAPRLASEPIPSPYPGIYGALEAENMIQTQHTGGPIGMKQATGTGFSGNEFWWTEGKAGGRITFHIDITKDDTYEFMANLAETPDSPIVRIYFNEKPVRESIDLFSEKLSSTGEVSLGPCGKGNYQLEVEFVGANDKAQKPYRFGLDYIRIRKNDHDRSLEN